MKDYIYQNKIFFIVISLLVLIILGLLINNIYNANYVDDTLYNNASLVKEEKEDVIVDELAENISVKVDVKGEVNNPGVYELSHDNVVEDAINMAGGFTSEAVIENINLSKKVVDEMVIYVFTKEEVEDVIKVPTNNEVYINEDDYKNAPLIVPEDKITDNESNNSLININNASKDMLMTLNGIGESKASAIITYRTNNGLFKSIDEIKNVSGIGDATYESIKDFITV